MRGRTLIEPARLAALRKESGLTFEEIASLFSEHTGRMVFEHTVRRMFQLPSISDNDALAVCQILGCTIRDIMSPSQAREQSFPFEVEREVRDLYDMARSSFRPGFEALIVNATAPNGWQNLRAQASHLFEIFTRPDLIDEPEETISLAIDLITNDFGPRGRLVSDRMVLNPETLRWLSATLPGYKDDAPTLRSTAVFSYSLLVLTSLLIAEMAISAMLLSPHRQQNLVKEYFELATTLESILTAIVDTVINNPGLLRSAYCQELELGNRVFDATLFAVAACRQIERHHESPTRASETINRRVLNGLVQRFSRTADALRISYRIGSPRFEGSSFGTCYLGLRLALPDPTRRVRKSGDDSTASALGLALALGFTLARDQIGDEK